MDFDLMYIAARRANLEISTKYGMSAYEVDFLVFGRSMQQKNGSFCLSDIDRSYRNRSDITVSQTRVRNLVEKGYFKPVAGPGNKKLYKVTRQGLLIYQELVMQFASLMS